MFETIEDIICKIKQNKNLNLEILEDFYSDSVKETKEVKENVILEIMASAMPLGMILALFSQIIIYATASIFNFHLNSCFVCLMAISVFVFFVFLSAKDVFKTQYYEVSLLEFHKEIVAFIKKDKSSKLIQQIDFEKTYLSMVTLKIISRYLTREQMSILLDEKLTYSDLGFINKEQVEKDNEIQPLDLEKDNTLYYIDKSQKCHKEIKEEMLDYFYKK